MHINARRISSFTELRAIAQLAKEEGRLRSYAVYTSAPQRQQVNHSQPGSTKFEAPSFQQMYAIRFERDSASTGAGGSFSIPTPPGFSGFLPEFSPAILFFLA
jgi:hypothetical protein